MQPTKFNWHNFKTIALWVIVFAIGGLTAINGGATTGTITVAISILGFIEHWVSGNTN